MEQWSPAGPGKRIIASGNSGAAGANDMENPAVTNIGDRTAFRPYSGPRRWRAERKHKAKVRLSQMDGTASQEVQIPEDLVGEPNECPVMVNGVPTLGIRQHGVYCQLSVVEQELP